MNKFDLDPDLHLQLVDEGLFEISPKNGLERVAIFEHFRVSLADLIIKKQYA